MLSVDVINVSINRSVGVISLDPPSVCWNCVTNESHIAECLWRSEFFFSTGTQPISICNKSRRVWIQIVCHPARWDWPFTTIFQALVQMAILRLALPIRSITVNSIIIISSFSFRFFIIFWQNQRHVWLYILIEITNLWCINYLFMYYIDWYCL